MKQQARQTSEYQLAPEGNNPITQLPQEVQADNEQLKIALENIYRIHGYQWSEYDRNVIKDLIGQKPPKPSPADNDLKALLPPDLNLAVIGHGKPERRVSGAVWVKASERLPGWRQKVRWRLDGIERKVNDVLYLANGESPAYLPDYEWLDEQPAAGDQWVKATDTVTVNMVNMNEVEKLQQLAIDRQVKGDRLVSALRSLRLSVTAHPDYTGQENAEWTDLVSASDEAIMDWLEKGAVNAPAEDRQWKAMYKILDGRYQDLKERLGKVLDGITYAKIRTKAILNANDKQVAFIFEKVTEDSTLAEQVKDDDGTMHDTQPGFPLL